MDNSRAEQTRVKWLETLERHKLDVLQPGSDDFWYPSLDCASRDNLIAIQNEKLAAVTPFLYENSEFLFWGIPSAPWNL